jgi:Tfp pilus assembly protein PilN
MRLLLLDYERKPRPHGVGYVLLLIGCGAALFFADQYRAVSQDLEMQRASLRKLQIEPHQAAKTDPRAAKEQDERMQAARVVLNQLTVPWDSLFRALESIEEKDVALLTMSPDPNKQQIKLLVEAKSMAAMLSYHRKLAESPAFSDVSLVDHEIMQQDPDRPVRFHMTATWIVKDHAHQ